MKLAPFIIDRFANFLLGSNAWGHAQAAVHIVDGHYATGAEKRQAACELLSEIGLSIANFLLNLAIELAVAKLRSMATNNE